MINDVQRRDFRGPWGKEGGLPASSPGSRGGERKRETTTSPTPVPPGELTRTLGGGKRLILRLPTFQNTKVYPVKASYSAEVSLGSFSNDDGSENVKKE